MYIKGINISLVKLLCLVLYYAARRYLPCSHTFFNVCGRIRYQLSKRTFKKCGKYVNIERGAWFGSGANIEIDDYSGIGIDAHIPSDTIIGKYVMMGPNCYIHDVNHIVDDIDTPMCFQGMAKRKTTIIEDDVWIGRSVSMTPGHRIAQGSIIGMNCVLTKDFPPYSIVGGGIQATL